MPTRISHVKEITRHLAEQAGHDLGKWTGPDEGRFGLVRASCSRCHYEVRFLVTPGRRIFTGARAQICRVPGVPKCNGLEIQRRGVV